MKKFAIAIMLLLPLCAFAQVPQLKDEKAQKELREALDKEVERLTDNLALEVWQESMWTQSSPTTTRCAIWSSRT